MTQAAAIVEAAVVTAETSEKQSNSVNEKKDDLRLSSAAKTEVKPTSSVTNSPVVARNITNVIKSKSGKPRLFGKSRKILKRSFLISFFQNFHFMYGKFDQLRKTKEEAN